MNDQSKFIIEILEDQSNAFSRGAEWSDAGRLDPEVALRLLAMDSSKYIGTNGQVVAWVTRLMRCADSAYWLEPEQGSEGYGNVFITFWDYIISYSIYAFDGLMDDIMKEFKELPSEMYGNYGTYKNGIWYKK